MKNWCVMLAAGRGTRSGLKENKVFFKWHGRSVLSRCIDAFYRSGLYEGIVLVLSEDEFEDYERLTQSEGACPLVKKIVPGGDERRKSAYNGLMNVPGDADIVSIHDAARPFVSASVMKTTIEDAMKYGSGIISTPVTDTIKQIGVDGKVTSFDRSTLRAVQTPQTFRYDMIMQAHRKAAAENIAATDDAMLFEMTFGSVKLSEDADAARNIKLTLPKDFETEKNMIGFRIGQGYDAHRLIEGRKLILCGVDVPHTRGLDGHSDADVAVHALMDAILGAIGEGDIGHRFPDSDERYKGISSLLLLKDVAEFAREKGFRVANADVTIVAQKPKIAPYISEMRTNIALTIGVDVSCINVKATTTEKMGFEGEEIGISSQAVALMESIPTEEDQL